MEILIIGRGRTKAQWAKPDPFLYGKKSTSAFWANFFRPDPDQNVG